MSTALALAIALVSTSTTIRDPVCDGAPLECRQAIGRAALGFETGLRLRDDEIAMLRAKLSARDSTAAVGGEALSSGECPSSPSYTFETMMLTTTAGVLFGGLVVLLLTSIR
jgi:hypothetical protein